jgi:uncharacterized membrane protein
MKSSLIKESPLIVMILLPFLYLGYIWNSLPARVPTHWNAAGKINGWGDKSSLLIAVGIPVFVYIILLGTRRFDPKGKLQNMGSKFDQLKFWMVLIMTFLSMCILYSSKTQSMTSPNFIPIMVGVLFTILGNYMPSMKPNYFIGIRTPWTLENETVWKKTHALAGKFWFAGGLIIIASGLILNGKWVSVSVLSVSLIICVVPITYSFFAFRKEPKPDRLS